MKFHVVWPTRERLATDMLQDPIDAARPGVREAVSSPCNALLSFRIQFSRGGTNAATVLPLA